jgi:septal ring-binding cell division protein DamX
MLDLSRTLLIASTCLAITACGIWSNKRSVDPIASKTIYNQKNDYWFCQANEAGDDWDCVQGPRMAMNPISTRFPKPPQSKPDSIATAQSFNVSDTPRRNPLHAVSDLTNVDSADDEMRTPMPAPQPKPTPDLKSKTPTAVQHDWQQFGYRSSASIALSKLPAHFYVVQIIAMSSLEGLQSFAYEHLLSDILAARVEANGELFYVLLLGTYETLTDAKSAAASRPESLMSIEPWVRKLGSLQDAIARGDVLADTTHY